MQLVETLHGAGMLCVEGYEATPAHYAISYWCAAGDDELVGVGHVSSGLAVMQAAGRGEPTILRLADGRRVEVTVKYRGAGTDWGYVEVTRPVVFCTGPAKVYSIECERARTSMELCTSLAGEAETLEDAAAWLDLADSWAQLLEVAQLWTSPGHVAVAGRPH